MDLTCVKCSETPGNAYFLPISLSACVSFMGIEHDNGDVDYVCIVQCVQLTCNHKCLDAWFKFSFINTRLSTGERCVWLKYSFCSQMHQHHTRLHTKRDDKGKSFKITLHSFQHTKLSWCNLRAHTKLHVEYEVAHVTRRCKINPLNATVCWPILLNIIIFCRHLAVDL